MLNLYTYLDTGSIVVYPDNLYTTSSYKLNLTQDINLHSGSLDVVKINNPNRLSTYLVLQYNGSNLPTGSGQYSYTLNLPDTIQAEIWGETTFTFGNANFKWGESATVTGSQLAEGRAYVYGTNDPTFNNYTTDNEQGSYITYYTG